MKRATSLALLCLAASAIAQGPTQTLLPATSIPQFVDRLPTLAGLDPAGTMTTIVTPTAIELHMREFRANVLPTGFLPPDGWAGGVPGTVVWGYINGPAAPTANVDSYIGPVVVALRGQPTEVTYVNNLGNTATSNLTFYKYATDQTLHWADPLGSGHLMTNYNGPIAAVAHLHGGEVPPQLDGGPDAWFTSDGLHHGVSYYSRNASDPGNVSVYRYPNNQEAANIWFHDHLLGATRLNVYAGLAGAWVITEPAAPANLPGPIVPLVIQDRSFDTNGQLYFPSVGINMEHPYWIPEFVGDTIVVNGKTWPFMNVEPKCYRFLFLNGSNARTYDLFLTDVGRGTPSMWILGTDGGYLDRSVQVPTGRFATPFVMMPGERYEVIIDFSSMRAGSTVTINNRANMPYPAGLPVDPLTTGKIMQFHVVAPTATGDGYTNGTYQLGNRLRGSRAAGTQPAVVRLPGTPQGPTMRVGTNVQRVRQMTLNEFMGMGGPLEVLVNNTKWAGHSVATDVFPGGMRPDFAFMMNGSMVSEAPNEGDVELWEIVNLTADAHPIHLHLVDFQLVSRQTFNAVAYQAAYDALFPGSTVAIDPMTGLPYAPGMFIGGFGPPLPYNATNALSNGKLGGNPDVYANSTGRRPRPLYMTGTARAPLAWEQGWKDTVVMYPGEVTRIMVRWGPNATPLATPARYAFNPNNGDGYVWHCHIVDHEDNEMMRPSAVMPDPAAIRSYNLGVDF